MDNVRDANEPNTGGPGCFVWVVLILVGAGLIGGIWSWIDDRGTVTVPMSGVVEIDDRFCIDRSLLINSDGTTLLGGNRNEQRRCEYRFSDDVEDRETFTFEVSGYDSVTVRRSMIDTVGPGGDTELRVRLSW